MLLVMVMLLASASAFATRRALLVGVSELVNQPQVLWLQAPRNDVMLMRDVLQKQGFAAADITVLADGVSGAASPDAQAIHDALVRLVAQSRSGDFVLLYFSGHGTRLRDATKRYQEPDGLAENFLARDVRGTVGVDAGFSGSVRDVDVDIDGWLQALLAKNVFVWSVFDTCSAASMTRGAPSALAVRDGPADDEVRWRGVRADQLARAAASAPAQASASPPVSEAVPRARRVAFFASESHQVTPELRLPRKDRRAQPQGLLTWAVAHALQRRPATWRELFDNVLALYPPVVAELETRFPERELPSPVAEGNLDAPLFANSDKPLTTRPVWRAQRSGASLAVRAGRLDGLMPAQALRVFASLEDGTRRSAEGAVSQIELASSQLQVPAALRDVSAGALWTVTPVSEPDAFALRVRADRPLPAGLSLDYPASIRLARAGEEADLRWTDQGAAGQRLELLAPAFGVSLRSSAADASAVGSQLQSLARLKWLDALRALTGEARVEGFEVALEYWRGDRLLRSEALVREARLDPPRADERIALAVRNTGGASLDMVIVGVDARGVPRTIYPDEPGASNRFERGTREQPAAKRFELPWLENGAGGGARLWVFAAPAAPYSAPRLFGAGSDPALSDLRVRGQFNAEKERQLFAATVYWSGGLASVK